jgi:DNA-binding XRE family transcriptional regulator
MFQAEDGCDRKPWLAACRLRKAAGYTQVELAAEVDITQLPDTFIEREKL